MKIYQCYSCFTPWTDCLYIFFNNWVILQYLIYLIFIFLIRFVWWWYFENLRYFGLVISSVRPLLLFIMILNNRIIWIVVLWSIWYIMIFLMLVWSDAINKWCRRRYVFLFDLAHFFCQNFIHILIIGNENFETWFFKCHFFWNYWW